MARVFISHSSRDNQQAAEMLEWLRRQGFDRAFLDIDKHAGIPPGARWERQLYQEIESAQAVILVLTPNWLDSKWCFAEFTQARALGKAIFPVIYAPGGESFIAPDIQNLDLRSDHQGGLERLGRELTRLALDAQGGFAWDPARAPYPGLLSFEKEDAAIFFGRDDDSNLLIERLNARRVQGEPKVLALLGASGSGKSSLLRAGVLPRLERDRRNWIVLPPFRPRHDPFAELARAAAEALGAPEEWRTWRDRFAAELPAALEDLADRLRIKAGAREAQVLLSIDQGEELFAISPEEATRFFALVKTAVADESPFVALLALRSDYLGHLQRSAAGVFRFQEYSLAPMPLARVRQIIEGPARVAGLEVEDALVEAAMRDAGTEDALPLLAFTLRELYDRYAGGVTSSDRQLLLAHYLQLADPAAGLNPLENSVRRRADEVTSELGADDLEALRNGFVESLVRVNSEGQYVRRPARWDELPERARPVLERLAGARLLVLGEEGGQRTAEVAHEALLRKWPRLTSWLDQKRDFLVGQTQLDGALADWQRAADADKPEALLGGLFLRRAAQWLVEHPRALSDAERIFVKESLRREAAIRRRRRLVAGGAIAAVVVFVAAIAFLLVRSVQGRRAVAAAQQRSAASLLALESRTALQAGETERAVVAATKAFDFLPTAETRSTLLQTLVALSPNLSRSITIDKLEPTFLAWLPGSERLLVGGSNGRIVGWRPAAGFAIEEVSSPADGPYVPPSLRGLVATGERRGLAVLGDGQLVRFEVDGNNGGASTTALAVDVRLAALGESGASALIASFAEGTVFSVDCRRPSGCRKAPIASGYATALALNERTVTAAVALEEGSVGGRLYVFDLSQGLPASPTIELATEFRIQSLAYDRAGHVLAAGGPGGDSFVIDAQGARRALPEQEAVTALAWNPADGRLAFACGSSVCISSTPGEGAAPLRPARRLAGHANTVVSLAWAPSGDTLASASTDGLVKLWQDRPDGWVARTLTAPDPPSSLTDLEVSADRRWIAAGTAQGGIHVWDARPLTLAGSLPNDGSRAAVRSLRWHPSRPWIAQADAAGIVVRSWPDGRTVSRIDLSAEPVEAILWAHSGASLFAALSTGRLVEWPLGGQPKPFSREHPESANALALEPRSHRLLSSDSLGNLWLWDSQSRKFAAQLGNLGQPVGTVAFDRAGTMALAAGNAGTLALYDMKAPPRESWRPSPGGPLIESAAFSPDGQLVAAVNVEGYLHVWSLARREIDLSVKLYPDGAPGHLSKVVWLPERAALAVSTSRGEVKLISTDVKEWLARARSVFQGAQSPSK